MSNTVQLGDISMPVGFYGVGDAKKKRFRKIGTLLETTDEHGARLWLRLNADIFHASLFALASAAGREKGEDSIIAQVFVEREKKPAAPAEPNASSDDF